MITRTRHGAYTFESRSHSEAHSVHYAAAQLHQNAWQIRMDPAMRTYCMPVLKSMYYKDVTEEGLCTPT